MIAGADKYHSAETSAVSISLPELLALRQHCGAERHTPRQVMAQQGEGYYSRFRGRGMEFAEVRSYQPGDDIRSIDWRVTARTGKPHTKLFHEERERPTLVAIDYRRPMFFATHGQFKIVKASQLAALIAWETLRRGDKLGAFIFSEELHTELRPRLGKKAVLSLFNKMVDNPVWQRDLHQPFEPQQRLFQTLMRLRRVVRPGSAVIIISDFSQWDKSVEKQLALLGRNNDLSLIFCYDQLEAQLPPAGNYPLSDGRRQAYINSTSAALRQQYMHQFALHREQIEQFCASHSGRFASCATDEAATTCFKAIV